MRSLDLVMRQYEDGQVIALPDEVWNPVTV